MVCFLKISNFIKHSPEMLMFSLFWVEVRGQTQLLVHIFLKFAPPEKWYLVGKFIFGQNWRFKKNRDLGHPTLNSFTSSAFSNQHQREWFYQLESQVCSYKKYKRHGPKAPNWIHLFQIILFFFVYFYLCEINNFLVIFNSPLVKFNGRLI